jgi:hypothetical protein
MPSRRHKPAESQKRRVFMGQRRVAARLGGSSMAALALLMVSNKLLVAIVHERGW